MKYFHMAGHIDTDMLGKFIDFSNSNQDEHWIIVLDSSGGGYFPTETIIKMINDRASMVQIIVQGAFSAGFLLLIRTKCSKMLSKTCRGMWHYGKWTLEYNDKHKPYYYDDEAIIRNLPFHKKETEGLAKKVMTAKEFKDFKADRDIYFDAKRMREIFPDAEIMK